MRSRAAACLRSVLILAFVVGLALPGALAAQTLPAPSLPLTVQCVDSSGGPRTNRCRVDVPPTARPQTAALQYRVMDGANPVRGAVVRAFATSGSLGPDSTKTDGEGYARFNWWRAEGAARAVVLIHVAADSLNRESGAQSDTVKIGDTGAALYGVDLYEDADNVPDGFEKSPLPRPVYVKLVRFETGKANATESVEEKCYEYRVAFKASGGGTLTPDTAQMWLDEDKNACVAYGTWTLPAGAGRRDAVATLVGPNLKETWRVAELEADARGLPHIVGGAAMSYYRSYVTKKNGTTAVGKLTRQLEGGSVASDTVLSTTRDTLQEVPGAWKPAAVIGVSSPLIPGIHRLSGTAGVDLNSPTRDWYLGVSALRVLGGLTTETLPVDIHALLHFGRSDVVEDQVACGAEGKCSTKGENRFHGVALMVSVDATALVADVLKKFIP